MEILTRKDVDLSAVAKGHGGAARRPTWSAYDGKCIRLQQSKTGARVVIPLAAPLKVVLDARPTDAVLHPIRPHIQTFVQLPRRLTRLDLVAGDFVHDPRERRS